MCSNIEWNSSLSISSSNPNSNSKNSLIYKIISPVCCFSKFFLKLCYLAKFSHHSKLTKRWAQLNPDLRVNRLGPDPLTIFPRKEKEWKLRKREEIVNPSSHLCFSIFSLQKPSSQSNSHSF